VLADRSKGENVAKSLIFLPMAISFVGAGIIWRFMYIARPPGDEQTGVMNAVWVWLGSVSSSTTGKIVAVVVLGIVALAMALLVQRAIKDKRGATAGVAAGFLLLMIYFIYRFLGPGIGGASADGDPETIIFFEDRPFNNVWLMVILIWIQTGFAMVILSSAIKAVPTELTEAAKIDGAAESQTFWRVTMPQIAPTVGVVITTLIVTVMKVFDIVKVTTNGISDTQVIANQMFEAGFSDRNLGLGSSLATILFVSVLPIMYVNIRRMQSQRV
jgi:ABC-type sugar transport system permease subunit